MQNGIHNLDQMLSLKCHGVRTSIYDSLHEYEPVVQ